MKLMKLMKAHLPELLLAMSSLAYSFAAAVVFAVFVGWVKRRQRKRREKSFKRNGERISNRDKMKRRLPNRIRKQWLLQQSMHKRLIQIIHKSRFLLQVKITF